MDINEHRRGVTSIILAAVIWSTGGLFIKLLPFDALTILFYRSFCAALLFGLVYRKEILVVNRLSWAASAVYAGLLFCFVSATKLTTAANAIFLQYTAPIYVLLLEPYLFKIRLERINLLTIFFCIGGMALFFADNMQNDGMLGNGLALLSGIFLACFLLFQRLNDTKYYNSAIFWGNVGVIFIGLQAFLQAPIPTVPQAAMLGFLGFIQIGLGYLLFNYGLKRTLAIESALLAMIEPILTPLWVWLGYGEQPSVNALIGGTIIIVSLAVRTIVTNKKPPQPAGLDAG